jgi:hypothetical protein
VTAATPENELERMHARAAENLDDDHLLLVLSDALMEKGDPQGRLIAFMLEEERATDLMRKVKVHALPQVGEALGGSRVLNVTQEWIELAP